MDITDRSPQKIKMINITSKVIKRTYYVVPVVQSVGIALDAKKILETFTPLVLAKIISGRFLKECKPPEIFITGKCIMFVEGVVASVSTGRNPLVISGTRSANFSISDSNV